MKGKKVCAQILSAVLCIGMAFPAFAYGGESIPQPEETEPPVMVLEEEQASAYNAEKEAAAQAERDRLKAEEDARKAAEEAAKADKPKENPLPTFAAAFLGILAVIGLACGGGFYLYTQQKARQQAEKEALDPDADYTEDKGDFEIPLEETEDREDF